MIPFLMFCQNKDSIIQKKERNDSIVFVITNKVFDSLQNRFSIFENHTDTKDPLKCYTFTSQDSTLNDHSIHKMENLNEILNCDKDLLIFIHGDGKTTNNAVMRGLKIQNLYDLKIIVFSWTSKMEKVNGLKNFKNSKKNIELGILKFKEMLLQIQELKKMRDFQTKKIHISLCMHSLGNYYMERMVKDSLLSGLHDELFDNIIFNAAAVNQKEHSKWMNQLHIQKRIYITSNKKDFNLNGVRVFTKSRKQLGERLKLPLSENSNYINFTKAIGFMFPTHLTHTYFLGGIRGENINQFYFNLFHGKEIQLNDSTLFIRRKDGLGHNILVN
ncbi:alpha/beta hydrolase [Labilibaculum antarcticum]|nr:alpha/beta hydrolase [Labilibaculum antarcticum]